MIETAENGRDFEPILCYDISRFSRGGTNETGYYLHRLKLAGVEVLFPADGIPEGDEGELIQGVKSWQARNTRSKLARDTIRGQISNIRERKMRPGRQAAVWLRQAAPDRRRHSAPDAAVDGRRQQAGVRARRQAAPRDRSGREHQEGQERHHPLRAQHARRVAVMKRMFELCVQGTATITSPQLFNNGGHPVPAA